MIGQGAALAARRSGTLDGWVTVVKKPDFWVRQEEKKRADDLKVALAAEKWLQRISDDTMLTLFPNISTAYQRLFVERDTFSFDNYGVIWDESHPENLFPIYLPSASDLDFGDDKEVEASYRNPLSMTVDSTPVRKAKEVVSPLRVKHTPASKGRSFETICNLKRKFGVSTGRNAALCTVEFEGKSIVVFGTTSGPSGGAHSEMKVLAALPPELLALYTVDVKTPEASALTSKGSLAGHSDIDGSTDGESDELSRSSSVATALSSLGSSLDESQGSSQNSLLGIDDSDDSLLGYSFGEDDDSQAGSGSVALAITKAPALDEEEEDESAGSVKAQKRPRPDDSKAGLSREIGRVLEERKRAHKRMRGKALDMRQSGIIRSIVSEREPCKHGARCTHGCDVRLQALLKARKDFPVEVRAIADHPEALEERRKAEKEYRKQQRLLGVREGRGYRGTKEVKKRGGSTSFHKAVHNIAMDKFAGVELADAWKVR
ncbi:MAG: hypothetical protein GWP59_07915 [Chlamydiales bacterium]|nr:hypothetical protein [Chlamydiales bacterium]